MGKRTEQKARELVGRADAEPVVADWCWLGTIPEPPPELRRGRIRPALVRPLGMLGYAVGVWFMLPMAGLVAATVPVEWVFRDRKERERDRRDKQRRREYRAARVDQGMDGCFDGDWHGEAGQQLLDWYGKSNHPNRLVVVGRKGVALGAPPRRVTLKRHRIAKTVLLEELPGARLETPLPRIEGEKLRMRLRFPDGSWLVLKAPSASPLGRRR